MIESGKDQTCINTIKVIKKVPGILHKITKSLPTHEKIQTIFELNPILHIPGWVDLGHRQRDKLTDVAFLSTRLC